MLIQHRNAAEASKGYVTYEPLAQTTLHVTRLLKANPAAAAKIETLQTERSPATIYLRCASPGPRMPGKERPGEMSCG